MHGERHSRGPSCRPAVTCERRPAVYAMRERAAGLSGGRRATLRHTRPRGGLSCGQACNTLHTGQRSSGDMKDITSEVGRRPADWMFGRGADALRHRGGGPSSVSLLTFMADRFGIMERRAPSAERRAPSAERRAPSAERRAPSVFLRSRDTARPNPSAAARTGLPVLPPAPLSRSRRAAARFAGARSCAGARLRFHAVHRSGAHRARRPGAATMFRSGGLSVPRRRP